MSEIVYIVNARLSFPNLVEPKAFQDNGAKKYSCDLLIPKDDPQFAIIMAAVKSVATEEWKEHANAVLQNCQANRKLRCYGAGEEKISMTTMAVYDGYEDAFYLSTATDEAHPVQFINAAGKVAEGIERTELARKMYGGCYVNAAARIWAQNNQFGKGIRCQLQALQFAKDGDAFGEGATDFSNMFGAVATPSAATTAIPSFLMP
jgi:hypothetical protein